MTWYYADEVKDDREKSATKGLPKRETKQKAKSLDKAQTDDDQSQKGAQSSSVPNVANKKLRQDKSPNPSESSNMSVGLGPRNEEEREKALKSGPPKNSLPESIFS